MQLGVSYTKKDKKAMKSNRELCERSYELGRRVFNNEVSMKSSVKELTDLGMNPATAAISIRLYGHLRNGEGFKRAHSIDVAEYYLNRIFEENGATGLEIAIRSMNQHLDYYESTVGSAKGRRDIVNKFTDKILQAEFEYPEEVRTDRQYSEGALKTIQVNAYERNIKARQECLKINGASCFVCGFNFEKVYGDIGKGYIHIHHKVDISCVGREYVVDPAKDMVPVCPNCHAMLHTSKPALDCEDLKERMRNKYEQMEYTTRIGK